MDTLRSVLTRLEKEGAAVGHFNVADLVLLKAVLAAAAEVKVPVLVAASEGELVGRHGFSLVFDIRQFRLFRNFPGEIDLKDGVLGVLA